MKNFFYVFFIMCLGLCSASSAQEFAQSFITQNQASESLQPAAPFAINQLNYDLFIIQETQLLQNFSPFSHINTSISLSQLSNASTEIIEYKQRQELAKKLTVVTYWQFGKQKNWQISLASEQLFWNNNLNPLNPALNIQTSKKLIFSSNYFITPNWRITGRFSNTSNTYNFEHFSLPQNDQQAIIGTTYRF